MRAARTRVLAVCVALAPGLASAKNQVQDQLDLLWTRPTPADPRSGAIRDEVSGAFDVTPSFDLTTRLSLTHDKATPPASGAGFGGSGGNIVLLGLGADMLLGHFDLGAAVDASPKARQTSDAPLDITTAAGEPQTVDTQVETNASSLGATLSATYDTADLDGDPRPVELAVTVAAGATRFFSTQKVTAISLVNKRGQATEVTGQLLLTTYCPKHPKQPVCKLLTGIETAQDESLTQLPLSLNADVTLFEDTDLGATFTYYAYGSDPDAAGIFTLSSVGRRGGSATFGAGAPLAPQLWSVRPEVAHAFGPVNVDLFVEHGAYVDDDGSENALGAKVKWRITRSWRLTLGVVVSKDLPGVGETGGDDTSEDAQPTTSVAASAAVRYTF